MFYFPTKIFIYYILLQYSLLLFSYKCQYYKLNTLSIIN